MIEYRTLTKADFPEIYRMMDAAFSDYYVPMDVTAESYQSKLDLEGGSFEYSVGAYDGGELVGATINSVGDWNGKRTVYDSGTGVIPDFRGVGIGRGMFNFLLPLLKQHGFEQYLLEVIVENVPAYRLYEGLGFAVTREFEIYRRVSSPDTNLNEFVGIREIGNIDWNHLTEFWSVAPSWQNSLDWIKRAREFEYGLSVLGLNFDGKLVGYGAVALETGKIAQIAVHPDFRRRGFGSKLICELGKRTTKPLIFSNIDGNAKEVLSFVKNAGFEKALSQYEMKLRL